MRKKLPDCVILDLMMPEMSGPEVLEVMSGDKYFDGVPVIVVTALGDMDKIVHCIEHGASDYMQKPFRAPVLRARLNACIERKKLHDREMELTRQLDRHNKDLEERIRAQIKQITAAQLGAIFAMCKLAESRDLETGMHLERVREYCRLVAERYLATYPDRAAGLSPSFVDDIYVASPLHDIGKVNVPDQVLRKPDKLTDAEFEIMKAHPGVGAQLLREVDREHPGNTFLRMGVDIAQSHHEKWDGSGYPAGLKGDAIPLSARMAALADVYDALTHARCYKPAFSHEKSAGIIRDGAGKHFDPELVALFETLGGDFQRISAEMP
jgi:putative two-component system response regulator